MDQVLKENSDHYYDSQLLTHDYWLRMPLSGENLQQFFDSIPPECLAIMITSKSKTPVDSYSNLVKQIKSKMS